MDINTELRGPIELLPDWEAAAEIEYKLSQLASEFVILGLAARTFPDAPVGLAGLYALTLQVRDAWHEYAKARAVIELDSFDDDSVGVD